MKNMIDYNIWKSNILSSIKDIASKDYQESAWLGKSNNQCSSLDEDIMMLYDSYCFQDDFWDETHFQKFNFNDIQEYELKAFKEQLDDYISKHMKRKLKLSDAEILNDPEWIEIIEKAKKVLSILE